MKYFIYVNDGEATAVPVDETTSTLKQLQGLVEGLITFTTGYLAGWYVDVVVNDEGLFREDFTVNTLASLIAGQQLVGPAVLSLTTPSGDTIGFSDDQVRYMFPNIAV